MPPSNTWRALACLPVLVLLSQELRAQPDVRRAPLRGVLKDPFTSFITAPNRPAEPQARPSPVPDVPPVAAPLPVQTVPELNLAFAGRLGQGPEQQVLVMHQGQLLLLQPGLVLGSGYVVKSIQAEAVELVYEPLKHVRRWSLPVPPSFEIR